LHGRGQIIWIGGEAGIGKSRLLEQASALAAERGFLYTVGRCFQGMTTAPYEPFLAALASLTHLLDVDDPASGQIAQLLDATDDRSASGSVAAADEFLGHHGFSFADGHAGVTGIQHDDFRPCSE
jgi:predicted ATPase